VQDSDEQYVTLAEGNKLKKEIHAFSLVECSAKEKLNLTLVFEEAVRAVEKKKLDDQRPKKSNCNIS
jgi:Ras-related C3 botulinum toxin substrate 1